MDDLLNGHVSEENCAQSSFIASISEEDVIFFINLQVENCCLSKNQILYFRYITLPMPSSFLVELYLDANASCFISCSSWQMISKMA